MKTMCANCMHEWFATPEQRNCPRCAGIILDGMDAKQLAAWLSRAGLTETVMREMVQLYGLELHLSDDARNVVELRTTPAALLGGQIARTLQRANIGQSDAWWNYNCTFRFFNDKADIAIDGLTRTNP